MPVVSHPKKRIGRAGQLVSAAVAAITIVSASVSATTAKKITASGTLQPTSIVVLGSQVSGLVQSITCEVNAPVKKGQLCAKLDPRPLQNAVDRARADLAQAKAELDREQASLIYAQAKFDGSSKLIQKGAITRDSFESAQSTLGQAKARIDLGKATIAQRQAALDLALLNLGYADIASPIEGVVIARKVEVGETLAASTQVPALFVVGSDPRQLKLVVKIGEADVGAIKDGNTATFTVRAFPSKAFNAKVTSIQFDTDTPRSEPGYSVALSVDNADLALKHGMTATVQINAGAN